jgi:hypothetical protein
MAIIKILQGLLSPIIAIIAVYIAIQQYYINKRKLNLDLYDKRFAIYVILKKFLMTLMEHGGASHNEMVDFDLETKCAKFIFEEDINLKIKEIINKTEESNKIKERIEPYHSGSKLKDDDNYKVLWSMYSELNQWFSNERQNLEDSFLKYLNFKNISPKTRWSLSIFNFSK